jgi:hypothetical protein
MIFVHEYVQVPGERSLGTYNLNALNEDVHLSLPSTSEVNHYLVSAN